MATCNTFMRASMLAAVLCIAPVIATDSRASDQAPVVKRYKTLVSSKMEANAEAMRQVASGCGGSVSRCRAALKLVGVLASDALTDLNPATPPDCLTAAHSEITKALALLVAGSNEAVAGIDADNHARVRSGSNKFDQGTAHLRLARTLIENSKCR